MKRNDFLLNVLISILILAPLCLLFFQGHHYQWHVIVDYRAVFLKGWLVTILISAICLCLSSVIGVLCALAKRSRIAPLRFIGNLYVEVIRGTPFLVQILIFFYVIANAMGIQNRFLVGVIILSIYSGAYLAEIFRSGIESISKSQLESAQAIGLTQKQTYRYIIFPQAFRITLPPIAGQFASLIKDSSLLSIIGIADFTYSAQQVNSASYSTLESFLPLAVGYLAEHFPSPFGVSTWKRNLNMKLKLAHLTKIFGTELALDDVTVDIPDGNVIAILGPSGGGKSTLLRLIGGLEVPTSGEITINDKPIQFEESYLLNYRRTIGSVFQSFNLFPHLTALENIELPLYRVHGLSQAAARDTAMHYLNRFGLQAHALKRPAELSGGQRQRVAIVRAVAIKASLLLLDEPTSALDPLMTSEVLDLVDELRTEGSNIIFASHHIGFVNKVSDYIIFLNEGKVLEYGPTKAFFASPKTAEAKQFLAKVLKY